MPIEEITLSVPGVPAEPQPETKSPQGSDAEARSGQSAGLTKLAAAYLKSARARDRFAFTDKGRMRNRERFGQSLKAIVKKIATDASSPVDDRGARMAVRTRTYADVMQLVSAMSNDQLVVIKRARTRLRWSLVLASLGLLGIALTFVLNGAGQWPASIP